VKQEILIDESSGRRRRRRIFAARARGPASRDEKNVGSNRAS